LGDKKLFQGGGAVFSPSKPNAWGCGLVGSFLFLSAMSHYYFFRSFLATVPCSWFYALAREGWTKGWTGCFSYKILKRASRFVFFFFHFSFSSCFCVPYRTPCLGKQT
jgi:hypothetical protein